jgi:hypothetical protein
MKSLLLTGYNEFYTGWLYALLVQPLPEDAHEFAKAGYQMALETGIENAIAALPAEIRLKHILVT